MPQAYAVSVVNYWRGLAEIRVHPARIMMLLQLAKMAFSNYFEANNNNSDNKAVHLKKKNPDIIVHRKCFQWTLALGALTKIISRMCLLFHFFFFNDMQWSKHWVVWYSTSFFFKISFHFMCLTNARPALGTCTLVIVVHFHSRVKSESRQLGNDCDCQAQPLISARRSYLQMRSGLFVVLEQCDWLLLFYSFYLCWLMPDYAWLRGRIYSLLKPRLSPPQKKSCSAE